MQLDPQTYDAHQRYINHLASCRGCYAPTNRYCFDGSALAVDYQAHALLNQSVESRRAFIARVESVDATRCEALKARMIDLHRQQKEALAQTHDTPEDLEQ
ncbi:hypothetical protein ACIPL1_27290 [Pseudomonas sp. NPDC090202]|uniref:hypothetical protein n=1 Tax=unclassified Pseudomonas TaxID=196821 RepID=UPI0037F48CB2